jgi:hypothetical protein
VTRSLRAALIALSLLAGATRAHAQQPADPSEGLLRQGVEMRRHGDDAGALEVFRRAYEQSHSAIALAQMGFAEQALGRWLEAETHVREALASSDPWITANRAEIDRAHDAIAQHVGTIELVGGVPGANVYLNGERVGVLPLSDAIRALAGRVTLEVRSPGYYPITREVTVVAGQPTRENLEFRRIEAGSTAPVADTGSTQRTGALIAAVGSVLLLGVGFGTLYWRESLVQDYNSDPQCPGVATMDQPPSCAQRVTDANIAQNLTTVGLVAGGIAAGLAVVLFLTAPSNAPRHGASLGFACGPGVGTVGVACGFRY